MKNYTPKPLFGFALLFVFSITSCTNTKKIAYFNNQKDTVLITSAMAEPMIQNNDLLSITVSSLNPDASALFNNQHVLYTSSINEGGTTLQSSGYLVNPQGKIQFPIIGELKAAGLTTNQLSLQIKNLLLQRKLLVDPIVNVRYLNFKVTVLGEVARPTVVNVPNEKITLLEAIGLAGDLTIYGKRDNIMLIREEAGKKIVRRLNLNSSELLLSPYYYLQPGDVVYVEPNKAKISSATNTRQALPLIFSGLSFVAIILDRVIQ